MTKHLSQEELLRHLDGELSRPAMRGAAKHLQACWSCQVEFERLKGHIATILDAQTIVFGPSMPPPPSPWPRLETRLEHVALRTSQPWWKKWLPLERSVGLRLAYGAAFIAFVALGISRLFVLTAVSAKEVSSAHVGERIKVFANF